MTELQPFLSVKKYSNLFIEFNLRDKFISEFGYIVPTAEVIGILVELIQPVGLVLDAGSGSGYLSEELSRFGVSTFSVDLFDYKISGKDYPIRKSYQQDVIGDACNFISSQIGAVLLICHRTINHLHLKLPRQCCLGNC